jgi:hypothetical protein
MQNNPKLLFTENKTGGSSYESLPQKKLFIWTYSGRPGNGVIVG